MKKTTLFLLVSSILISTYSVFAGAVIKDFKAEPGTNKVTLKWTASAEIDLKEYQIWRSHDGINFSHIGSQKAEGISSGEKTYTFIDNSVFKPNDRTYYYKLYFVSLSDGSVVEYGGDAAIVSPQISSARQTWGSIKAMFR